MKIILFAFFCALIAISLARPQVSYEKNGPAKLYKGDGDDDGGYGTGGDGKLPVKLYPITDVPKGGKHKNGPAKWYKRAGDGDGDGGYGTGDGEGEPPKIRLDEDSEDHGKNGNPVSITGAPQVLAGDEGEATYGIGDPVAVTGSVIYKGDGDGKSDNGDPVAVTGDPEDYKLAGDDGDGSYNNGDPVAVTGEPKVVYLRTSHVAANVYKVSSAIAQKYAHGKPVARVSRNGPHRLISTK
ncbi:hypothetical protein CRE_31122 [Caenorhabditis remanei]|uniref:Uncharacterized protein n=1 Tax=Caenorhabditis remanei TaxID=31234 RepID=E3LUR8_CAERE|nr:hypothetical protein CRE_31122 [Caenorhabditis remanei]